MNNQLGKIFMFLFSPRSSKGLRQLQLNTRTLNWKQLPKLWKLLFAATQQKLLLAKLEEMPKLRSTSQICPAREALGSFSCPEHIGCLALLLLRWDTELLQQLPLAGGSSYSKTSADISAGVKPSLQGLRSAPNIGGCPNPAVRNAVLLSLLLLHEAAVSSASSEVQTQLSQNWTLIIPWCSWE